MGTYSQTVQLVRKPVLDWSEDLPDNIQSFGDGFNAIMYVVNVQHFEMVDANDLRWEKASIAHKPIAITVKTLQTLKPHVLSANPRKPSDRNEIQETRTFTPMKVAEKRKGRASDTCDLKQNNPDKRAATITTSTLSSSVEPVGCKWSSNSCAYDATIFVLYNLWCSDTRRYSAEFGEFQNQWMDMDATSFQRHKLGEYPLEDVRDYIRRALHREYPNGFVFGRNTSVEVITTKIFHSTDTFTTVEYRCRCGEVSPVLTQNCCVVVPHSTAPLRWNTLQQFFDYTQSIPVSTPDSVCASCYTPARRCTTYNIAPPVIPLAIAFIDVAPQENICLATRTGPVRYGLIRAIYFGHSHFTARYVDPDGIV